MEHLEDRHITPLVFGRGDAGRSGRRPSPEVGGSGPTTPVKVSVVMAAHNEARTIQTAVSEILDLDTTFELELVVVDDGSSDGTSDLLRGFADPRLTVLRHPACRGKGAAIMSAAAIATGSHLLIFDADLEYSATDIPALVEPVLKGISSVVYGARVAGMRTLFPSFRYALGSRVTTVFANLVFDSFLADMHTCLKLMPLALFRQLSLAESGFGLDTEITGEVLRRGIRPYEVPCSYRGRSIADGKKISARDGLECFKVVLQVRLRGRVAYDLDQLEPLRVLPAAQRRERVATSSGSGASRAH